MPRASRLTQSGIIHHVISKGNANQDIFKDTEDYKKYISLLREAANNYPLFIYNFALLKNTIQLLVEPKVESSLSRVMENSTREYAKYFNQKYNSIGHVFAGRFKSFAIEPSQFFFACSRFIDLSPVTHQLVKESKDYLWCGYQRLAYGKDAEFQVDQHDLYKSLGNTDHERQLVYRSLVHQYFGQDLDLENRKTGVLGSKDFKSKIKVNENV